MFRLVVVAVLWWWGRSGGRWRLRVRVAWVCRAAWWVSPASILITCCV